MLDFVRGFWHGLANANATKKRSFDDGEHDGPVEPLAKRQKRELDTAYMPHEQPAKSTQANVISQAYERVAKNALMKNPWSSSSVDPGPNTTDQGKAEEAKRVQALQKEIDRLQAELRRKDSQFGTPDRYNRQNNHISFASTPPLPFKDSEIRQAALDSKHDQVYHRSGCSWINRPTVPLPKRKRMSVSSYGYGGPDAVQDSSILTGLPVTSNTSDHKRDENAWKDMLINARSRLKPTPKEHLESNRKTPIAKRISTLPGIANMDKFLHEMKSAKLRKIDKAKLRKSDIHAPRILDGVRKSSPIQDWQDKEFTFVAPQAMTTSKTAPQLPSLAFESTERKELLAGSPKSPMTEAPPDQAGAITRQVEYKHKERAASAAQDIRYGRAIASPPICEQRRRSASAGRAPIVPGAYESLTADRSLVSMPAPRQVEGSLRSEKSSPAKPRRALYLVPNEEKPSTEASLAKRKRTDMLVDHPTVTRPMNPNRKKRKVSAIVQHNIGKNNDFSQKENQPKLDPTSSSPLSSISGANEAVAI